MEGMFKARPVKKGGNGGKKKKQVLTSASSKEPAPTKTTPGPIISGVEVVGESTGPTKELDSAFASLGVDEAPAQDVSKARGKRVAEDPKRSSPSKKLKPPKPPSSSNLSAETALTLQKIEVVSANRIPPSSAFGAGFGGSLALSELWRSFHNHYVALGKRFAWMDQVLILQKNETARLKVSSEAEIRSLKTELLTLKETTLKLEQEKEEWKKKAKSAKDAAVKEYLESDGAVKAREEAEATGAKNFRASAEFKKLVREEIAEWRSGEEGRAWLEEQKAEFLQSRQMADFFMAGMTAAHTLGVTDLAKELKMAKDDLPSDFPDSFDEEAQAAVLKVAAEFGLNLANRSPPEDDEEGSGDEEGEE